MAPTHSSCFSPSSLLFSLALCGSQRRDPPFSGSSQSLICRAEQFKNIHLSTPASPRYTGLSQLLRVASDPRLRCEVPSYIPCHPVVTPLSGRRAHQLLRHDGSMPPAISHV
ncbi:hypothetical protein B0H11DRAFT_2182645 [Mycena galericulata]|nr:hypothetical protein B0H11DRAFT_2182645 [Mycena galericulata]